MWAQAERLSEESSVEWLEREELEESEFRLIFLWSNGGAESAAGRDLGRPKVMDFLVAGITCCCCCVPFILAGDAAEGDRRRECPLHCSSGREGLLPEKLEGLFAEVARLLVAGGVSRLITAGGETSGAVVEGLSLNTLEIGPEIAPGVPALRASGNLVIALKSGNFGGPNFFAEAADILAGNGQVQNT